MEKRVKALELKASCIEKSKRRVGDLKSANKSSEPPGLSRQVLPATVDTGLNYSHYDNSGAPA